MGEYLEARLQPTGGLRFLEGGNQIRERAVVDAPAALRGGNRQADRQVRLADTGRSQEDDILAALHETDVPLRAGGSILWTTDS